MLVRVHRELLKEAVVQVKWATELEGAAMSVSISLSEGVEEWRGDRARRGCYECFHIPV